MKVLSLGICALTLVIGGAALAVPQERAEAARDGVTTRAEAQARAERLFARFDVNRDGRIDRADREARMATMMQARFDRLDADHNGSLSRSEFADRQSGAMAGNRRGFGQRQMGRPGAGHGMMMGRMGDRDGDGALTHAEFAANALERFDRLDVNHDGQLTREERQAGREQMRERMGRRGMPQRVD
jgi:hypothetical protein